MLGRQMSPSKGSSSSSRARLKPREELPSRTKPAGDTPQANATSVVPASSSNPPSKPSAIPDPTSKPSVSTPPVSQRRLDAIQTSAAARDRALKPTTVANHSSPGLRPSSGVAPSIPDWVKVRPYLSGCQYLGPLSQISGTPVTVKQTDMLPLGSYPPAVQEILVVEDLLYCMMGLDGRHATVNTYLDNVIVGASSCD